MKVKNLIPLLQAMHSESDVWVERAGEHRQLEDGDISESLETCIYDADNGVVLEEHEVPVVTITSWD